MILSILKRHYKSYNNINYIPISTGPNNNFSLFVGNNGVGKSSILEALNTFFNNGYWNKTKNEKKDDTFVCPIFFINKKKFSEKLKLKDEDCKALDLISNYFFELSPQSSKELKALYELKESLKGFSNECYLLLCGITYKDQNKIYFSSSFDNEIKVLVDKEIVNYKIDNILNFVKSYCKYP